MSDQNNTSFAHAFLPGLILGLIVGAVAGAFVPDMMSARPIKFDPSHTTGDSHTRDERPIVDPAEQIIDDAEDDAEHAAEDLDTQAIEEKIDDAKETVEDAIDDMKNNLPTTP